VLTTLDDALILLRQTVEEMESRYLLSPPRAF